MTWNRDESGDSWDRMAMPVAEEARPPTVKGRQP